MRLAGKFVGSGKNEKNQRVARPTRSCTRMYARRESSLSFFWVTERERKEEKEPQMGNANIPITSHWLGLNSGERDLPPHNTTTALVHKLLIFLQESDIGFSPSSSSSSLCELAISLACGYFFKQSQTPKGTTRAWKKRKGSLCLALLFRWARSGWVPLHARETRIQWHSTTYDGSWRNESRYINKPREWISDV